MTDTPSPDDPIFGDKPDEPLLGASPSAGSGQQPSAAPPPSQPAGSPPPSEPPTAPPPTGQPVGGAPMAPPPQYGYEARSSVISDAFSWAVEAFRQNAQVWIGLAAVVFALRAAQTIIGNAVATNNSGNAFTAGLAAALGLVALLGVVFAILAALASVGVYRAALRRTQGVTPTFDMLTSGENLGQFIIVSIVTALAVGVGLVLCIIPGLVAIFFLMFAPYLALDKGMGVGDAFRTSWRMVVDNLGTVAVAALINIVANILSGLIFGILVLLMLPFSALFTAYVYRRIQGEPVAP